MIRERLGNGGENFGLGGRQGRKNEPDTRIGAHKGPAFLWISYVGNDTGADTDGGRGSCRLQASENHQGGKVGREGQCQIGSRVYG